MTRLALRLVLPLLLLALWWTASRSGEIPAILLPTPGRVLESAWSMAVSGELWKHTAASLARVAAGFAAAGHNGGAQVTQLRYMLCQVFICVVPRRGNQS